MSEKENERDVVTFREFLDALTVEHRKYVVYMIADIQASLMGCETMEVEALYRALMKETQDSLK